MIFFSKLYNLNQMFFGEENIVITKSHNIFLFFSYVGSRETEKTTKRVPRIENSKLLDLPSIDYRFSHQHPIQQKICGLSKDESNEFNSTP